MYEYLDRFVSHWSDDDLIAVLSKLPANPVIGEDWAALIAAVGVKNFLHLSLTIPGKEIKIPSLFEILCVVAAEGIAEKSKEIGLEAAKDFVLGELDIKEVDELVYELQAAEKPLEASNDS